jgi:hypothetical protein
VLTLANASVYLEAFGHIVIAWIWLQQAGAAHGKDGDFLRGQAQRRAVFLRAGNCPRSPHSSTCSPAWIAARWICATAGFKAVARTFKRLTFLWSLHGPRFQR